MAPGVAGAPGRRPVSFPLVTDDPTPPRRPRPSGPVQYRGEDLEAERGPGLGCFRFQVAVLVAFIVLTPLSVVWGWPEWVSAFLLFAVIGLLLVTGQTIIFLLRLVSAERRGRRVPLGSASQTVGQLEDAAAPGRTASGDDVSTRGPSEPPSEPPAATGDEPSESGATPGDRLG